MDTIQRSKGVQRAAVPRPSSVVLDGPYLCRAIAEKLLTRAEFSARAKIVYPTLWRALRGEHVQISTAKRIARALGVGVTSIIRAPDNAPREQEAVA